MIRFVRVVGLLVVALAARASAENWHVATARARVTIHKTEPSPWPAKMGVVKLGAAGLDRAKLNVTVLTVAGTPVGSQVLWAAPGDSVLVAFDSTGSNTSFYVYLGEQPARLAVPAWESTAGVLLETRPRVDSLMENFEQFRAAWQKSTIVQGRCVVPDIFLGVNPLGPGTDFMSAFTGTLNIGTEGEYGFATISDDASFLLIDTKLVAQWPGFHGVDGGRYAEHRGKIRLTAGPHKIKYYHVQGSADFTASAAWKPPGQERFTIIHRDTYGLVAQFEPVEFASPSANPGLAYFDWRPAAHSTAYDMTLVSMDLRAFGGATNATYRWTFDDGTTATGSRIRHLFPRPGARLAKLDVFDGDRRVATLTERINVTPHWSQRDEWPEDFYRSQRDELLARDYAPAPLDDIAYLARLADKLDERVLLNKLAPEFWKRHADIRAENADVFFRLAFRYKEPQLRDYPQSEKAFRAVLAIAGIDEKLRERTKLHLGVLLLRAFGKADEALALFHAVERDKLSGDEQRLLTLLRGDALLAQGDVAGARKVFLSVSDPGSLRSVPETVRRRARLETARAFLNRRDYDFAEDALRQIEWDSPLERLSVDTGLAWVQIHMARNEVPLALARCRTLLNVADSDSERAEVYYRLIEINLALSQKKAAGEVLARLLKEFPYTEAAARAKDKWPAGF